MQEYLFDLNGYLVLRGAISPDDVAAMNATYDAIAAAEHRRARAGSGAWP